MADNGLFSITLFVTPENTSVDAASVERDKSNILRNDMSARVLMEEVTFHLSSILPEIKGYIPEGG